MQLHKDSRHVSEQSFDHPSNSSSSMQDRQTFLSSLPPLLCKQQQQQQPEVILDWQLSISQACSSLVSQYNVPIVYLLTYLPYQATTTAPSTTSSVRCCCSRTSEPSTNQTLRQRPATDAPPGCRPPKDIDTKYTLD